MKDTVLDQFEEGEYQATVWISEIFLAQYISYGKAITEIRARLHDLQVDSAGELHETRSEPTEPDPIDEEARGPTVAPAAPSLSPTPTVLPKSEAEAKPSTFDALKSKLDNIRGRKQQPPSKEAPASASNDDSLRELFGEAIWQQVQGPRSSQARSHDWPRRAAATSGDHVSGRLRVRSQAASLESEVSLFEKSAPRSAG